MDVFWNKKWIKVVNNLNSKWLFKKCHHEDVENIETNKRNHKSKIEINV